MASLLSDLNLKRTDYIYLLIILVFSSLLFTIKVLGYKIIGIPDSDVMTYLFNSLYYSGLNANGVGDIGNLYSSPVICFLTGILFKIWHVSPTPILIVTGVFEILGNIGLYLLFKNRFRPVLSLLGTILFTTSTLFVFHSSSGMLDIPACAVSIWILVFSILAIDKSYKYHLIAIPLFVIGIFTRPTVAFVLPLMILYFMSKYDVIRLIDSRLYDRELFKSELKTFLQTKDFKYIVLAFFICFLIVFIVSGYHYLVFDYVLPYFDIFHGSISAYSNHANYDVFYNTDWFFYIKLFAPQVFNLDKISYFNFYLLIFLAVLSVAGLILKYMELKRNVGIFKDRIIRDYYKTPNFEKGLNIVFVLLIVGGVLCFNVNYLITEVLFFIDFLIFMSLINKYNFTKVNGNLSIIMLAWIVFYFVFITYISIKLERYALPMMIPLIYFIIFSIEGIVDHIDYAYPEDESRFSKRNLTTIAILLFVFILMAGAISTVNYNFGNEYNHRYNDYENVTDYMEKNITADRFHRYYSWFLDRPVDVIDPLQQPLSAFDSCGSDYILLYKSYKFENYTQIYKKGVSHLYVKNSDLRDTIIKIKRLNR